MWYKAKGKLRYDDNGGWVVLDCPQSIVNYYGYWVKRLTWRAGSTPFHGAHVTVVAGKYQDVRHHPLWKKHDKKWIDFEYSNIIEYVKYSDGSYYWLPVRCDFLKTVRAELGLDPTPKWQYHLTCYFVQS